MQTSISRNRTPSQIDVYLSLLEEKQHLSLVKPIKIKFLNEPKQTEQAKHKHGVNTIYTNMCDL